MKSEKDAYMKALEIIISLRIDLERYYSEQSTIDDFSENSSIRRSKRWREIIRGFMSDPIAYLREYFKRNNSETGLSAGKRSTGHLLFQRRKDRIETS